MVKNSEKLLEHFNKPREKKVPKRNVNIRRGELARQQGYICTSREAEGIMISLTGLFCLCTGIPITMFVGLGLSTIGILMVLEEQ